MEQQHRRPFRLAWIAIAVGMLALGLVIGNLMGGARTMMFMSGGPMGAQRWAQQVPGVPQGPGFQQDVPQDAQPNAPAQPGWRGPRGDQGYGQAGPGFQGRYSQDGHMMAMRGHGGMRGGIFGMIGGLIKLVFWGLGAYLIFLAARDRWGKNRGGTPPPQAPAGGGQTSARPGPEEPPYTGMTTNL
jgi:hypothetical protein